MNSALAELERKIEGHDTGIRPRFDAVGGLPVPPAKPRGEIGFHVKAAPDTLLRWN